MNIEDGTGSGRKAKVDSSNRLHTLAITATAEHHANYVHGQAYHAQFARSPTANDDCIFYMVNNSALLDMIVEGLYLQIDGVGEVYMQLSAAGTRNAAVAIIPTNVNAKSGNLADGTFEQGVDLSGGAATLANGTEFERYVFNAANNSEMFNFEADVVLGRDNTLTIWCDTLARTVTGTVVFHFSEPE